MGEIARHTRPTPGGTHSRRRRTLTAVLGSTVLLFAVIGFIFVLVTVSRLVYRGVRSYVGPAETPAFFAGYVTPVTASNPDPFDSIDEADRGWMLKTAVWAAAKAGTTGGSYMLDDQGNVVVPAADVKSSFENLFGKKIQPDFRSVTDTGVAFEYNAKGKAFHVPTTSLYSLYTPQVAHITRHGDTVTLTVQYMAAGSASSSNTAATPAAPAKTMQYVLRGSRGRYAVTAIREESSASSAVSSAGASSAASGSSASSGGTSSH